MASGKIYVPTSLPRTLTATILASSSINLIISGNNYDPGFSMLLSLTGNAGPVMGVWLVYGFGIRTAFRTIIPLGTSSWGGAVQFVQEEGLITISNTNSSYSIQLCVTILEETVPFSISLS